MGYGPVQYFEIVFPGNDFKGEIIPALQEVIANGLIRIVDIVFAMRDADGTLSTFEIDETSHQGAKAFSSVVSTISGLLSTEDIQTLAANIPANTSAALLVFEHVWATKLADSIRNANGQVVAQGFVPREIVEEVAKAKEATA